MTTLQKGVVTAALALAIGIGVYESRQASAAKRELQNLQQKDAPVAEQLQRLQEQSGRAAALAQTLQTQNAQLQQQLAELPRLRAEVASLRSASPAKTAALDPADPGVQHFLAARAQARQIAQYFEQMPEKKIPELTLLSDIDWLTAVKESKFDTETDIRRALSNLRSLAKNRLPMGRSLNAFLQANDGVLPTDLAQLKPNIQAALAPNELPDATLDQILQRYTLLKTGKISDYPPGTYVIVEKEPVDKDYDTRAKFGDGRSTIISAGHHETGDPDDKSY